MIIKNGFVFQEDGTFRNTDIFTNQEFLSEQSNDGDILDASGLYVIPGLIDIHFHGCVGYDFCDGTTEATEAIANYQVQNGITSIVPATMALDDPTLEKVFTAARLYPNQTGAMLMGIHMEGPYLSKAKKGAQKEDYLKAPSIQHFRAMNKLSGNLIKIVSIAPETDGALEVIKALKDEVVLSLAHTTADYDTAMQAFQNGASHVTHLYNAMLPFYHREPGVPGAAFDTPSCHVELICDGLHIAPSVIRATFQMFGKDRIILVSDSMMATGLYDGEYALGGQSVTVIGNKATLPDGTLAGSVTNLMSCVKMAVSMGIPLETAITCATSNPAKEVGIYAKVGSITPGKYANLVLLDSNLNLVSVLLKGNTL